MLSEVITMPVEPPPARSVPVLHCSFCGRDNASVRKLIAGPGVYICDACVAACGRILDGQAEGDASVRPDEQAIDPAFGNWRKLSDQELLRAVAAVDRTLDELSAVQHLQVSILRERETSWSAIGAALGTSRQAAWERFGSDR
jgi:hypothetical protein